MTNESKIIGILAKLRQTKEGGRASVFEYLTGSEQDKLVEDLSQLLTPSQVDMRSLGIVDRKGKEVFVGDIVGLPYVPPFGGVGMDDEICYKAKVVFKHGGFFLEMIDYDSYTENINVIDWLVKEKGEYVSNYGNKTILKDIAKFEVVTPYLTPKTDSRDDELWRKQNSLNGMTEYAHGLEEQLEKAKTDSRDSSQHDRELLMDFERELSNKCLHDSINDSYSYPLEEVPNVVYGFIEEYLKTIESEGK